MAPLILEVVEGPDAGRQIELASPIEIGRDPNAGLVIDEPQVSRSHARLSPVDDGVVVEDLRSTNGTFVNGNEIVSPTLVRPGDQLLVGVSVLLLRSPQEVAARPSAVHALPPALARPARPPDYLPTGAEREAPVEELDALLDVRTKAKARLAPLAIFLLVVVAILVYLATRG